MGKPTDQQYEAVKTWLTERGASIQNEDDFEIQVNFSNIDRKDDTRDLLNDAYATVSLSGNKSRVAKEYNHSPKGLWVDTMLINYALFPPTKNLPSTTTSAPATSEAMVDQAAGRQAG